MNKKLILLFLYTSFIGIGYGESQVDEPLLFEIKSDSKKYSKIKSILLCHEGDSLVLNFAKIVSEDLDFTDQFEVECGKTSQVLDTIVPQKLFADGKSLLIYFEKKAATLVVTVRDTSSNFTLFEKTVPLDKQNLVYHSHSVANDILEALTGEKGICLSTLAYCEQLAPTHKVIRFSDYACKQTRAVVRSRTINIAPRWQNEKLFYSQLTRHNNRLMLYNPTTKRSSIARSYPGLNMQPTFSANGHKTVVCFSEGKGNSELYLYDAALCAATKKRAFIQLTKNKAHNVSPCMLPDENLVFCSDFRSEQPQLYHMDIKTKKTTRLTNGRGYAAAPSYCAKNNSIVYVRPTNGVFQLFMFSLDDMSNVKEQQLTTSVGSKQEPCWSEDGRYIVFSQDIPGKNGLPVAQIAVMNVKSGKVRILTHDPAPKSFPRWTDKTVWA